MDEAAHAQDLLYGRAECGRLQARVAALEAERDRACKQAGDAVRAGALDGTWEHWRDRAEQAEARVAELETELAEERSGWEHIREYTGCEEGDEACAVMLWRPVIEAVKEWANIGNDASHEEIEHATEQLERAARAAGLTEDK